MIIRHLILLAALSPFAAFGAEKIGNFQSATYTEVVKDVSTVSGKSGKAEKAKSGVNFTNEDLVKSGRGSRAQLTVPDGTIIRVGPNAVFSLDKSTRALNLESGSVLFYTPPGAGGGKIVTESVTCAVTGTTITVTMDPVGGFKLQVLEGTVIVTNKAGQQVTVGGGQSLSLPIGFTGPMVNKSFSTADVTSAILLSGFDTPLPSASKIVDSLGAMPKATPQELANGTDTALASNGTTTTTPSTNAPGTTSTPAAVGLNVVPDVAQSSGLLDSKTGQPISGDGSAQLN